MWRNSESLLDKFSVKNKIYENKIQRLKTDIYSYNL